MHPRFDNEHFQSDTGSHFLFESDYFTQENYLPVCCKHLNWPPLAKVGLSSSKSMVSLGFHIDKRLFTNSFLVEKRDII